MSDIVFVCYSKGSDGGKMIFSGWIPIVILLLGCVAITGCSERVDIPSVKRTFPVLWLSPDQLECSGVYRDKNFKLPPEKSHEMAVLVRSILTDSGAKHGREAATKEDAECQIVIRGKGAFAEHQIVCGLYERYGSIELPDRRTVAVSKEAMEKVLSLIRGPSSPIDKEHPTPAP